MKFNVLGINGFAAQYGGKRNQRGYVRDWK